MQKQLWLSLLFVANSFSMEDPNRIYFVYPALEAASKNPEQLRTMIAQGHPFIFPDEVISAQPIYAAFHSLNSESVEILLESGVKLDQRYKGILDHCNEFITLEDAFKKNFLTNNLDLSKSRELLKKYLDQHKNKSDSAKTNS